MSTNRCPQCSSIVTAGDEHCSECGYPLQWQAAGEDDDAGAGVMVRRPGEPDDVEETGELSAAPIGDDRRDVDEVDEVAPDVIEASIVCASCGASNPAGRTLCHRCGMDLSGVDEADDGGRAWWRRPGVAPALLALVVLAAAVAVWLVVRDGASDADPAAGGPASTPGASDTAGTETSPEPETLLQEGDTGPDVAAWQRLLQSAGFEISADAVFGPRTGQATSAFQRTIGEEPTGTVSTRTMQMAERLASLELVDVHLVRDGELEAVARRVDEAQLAGGALQALLAAPLQAEEAEGLASSIPAGTSVGGLRVDAGTATVRLDGFAADPEQESLRRRVDQVVRTLTQFPSIDAVRFRLPTEDLEVFSQAGVDLSRPRSRDG